MKNLGAQGILPALYLATSDASLSNVDIQNTAGPGIQYYGGGNTKFDSVTLKGNTAGFTSGIGSPVLKNCVIIGNRDFGVQNQSNTVSDTIDARGTYWGTNTGPYHPVLNPSGTGDQVSDRVKFLPVKPDSLTGQSILFTPIGDKTFDDADFELSAVASSGLGVRFMSSDTSVLLIIGNTAHIRHAGTVAITAVQSGDTTFSSAKITQTLLIRKARQQITFPAISMKNYNDPPFAPGATSNSGLPIRYTSSSSAIAFVKDSLIYPLMGGDCIVTAYQDGNGDYDPDSVSQKMVVRFFLPANNFQVSVISATCRGTSDGS
ncbi:MAG: right-handed parallel beta-helix repeat-containing protein, partial [Bacteroidetes bacterium]|nr:right-handed parallel beta-helix repeat-containing protein [Bacteroidota bacterium]